ncbi:MAG: hypothetical protein Q9220_007491 [cf. Caloplaca sp. 1 TL-2023]
MDMKGQSNVMNLFCKAYHDDEDPIPEIAHQIVRPQAANNQPTPPSFSWVKFTFSATALAAIKSNATITLPPGVEYISTDDALSAFIWQSTARVRQHRFSDPTPK